MDDFMRLLTLVLTVVTIATACGLGLQRGRIASLQSQLDDSRKEIADKDRRLSDAERSGTEQAAEMGRLRTDLGALGRVVTGEAHWTAIGHKLDEHHDAAAEHWETNDLLLKEIRDRLPERGTR
jgi:hypothetical protein